MALFVTAATVNMLIKKSLLALIDVPVIISFVFLIIGLYMKKLKFMKQFIYIYLGYLVIQFIVYIITIILTIIVFGMRNPNINAINYYVNVDDFIEKPFEVVRQYMFDRLILYPVLVSIGYLIELIYYNITGSYIEQFENNLEKELESRKLEENEQ
ncbi:hypothetical protein H8356DRAFT_1284525 [Neocallimastix lanati (nom. inval.)]|nr:hypothetical protein H8356DRAFT_1284525 [Neocallimastix sp. JGI-2020a]